MISHKLKLLLSESLGENVGSLLRTGTVPQNDDPVMNQFFDVVDVDLNMFGPLSLH